MSELIAVNIVIGDRSYRIKTKPSDEETIRKTVKVINDKVIEFKTMFAGKDMQDYIAMVIIWYATQNSPENEANFQTAELLTQIKRTDALLDDVLKDHSA